MAIETRHGSERTSTISATRNESKSAESEKPGIGVRLGENGPYVVVGMPRFEATSVVERFERGHREGIPYDRYLAAKAVVDGPESR